MMNPHKRTARQELSFPVDIGLFRYVRTSEPGRSRCYPLAADPRRMAWWPKRLVEATVAYARVSTLTGLPPCWAGRDMSRSGAAGIEEQGSRQGDIETLYATARLADSQGYHCALQHSLCFRGKSGARKSPCRRRSSRVICGWYSSRGMLRFTRRLSYRISETVSRRFTEIQRQRVVTFIIHGAFLLLMLKLAYAIPTCKT